MGTQHGARVRNPRRATAERERGLAALAERQHGVLSHGQVVAAGLGPRTIRRRVEAGRLHPLHRGVYAFGRERTTRRGRWMAAVLACGEGALLSHRSAAALWGLMRSREDQVEVSASSRHERPDIAVHEGGICRDERTIVERIPVTSVARTLFDVAEVVDDRQLELAFEEADRLGQLEMRQLEAVCARGVGRRALRPIRRLIDAASLPTTTRSPLEERIIALCREHGLPLPQTNCTVLDCEVDAYWPRERLVVEADGWAFHRHRAAFERDRARDAAMQAAGYRVVRLTHRRLEQEPVTVAAELRLLLGNRGRAAT
jgi:predicted transcriptional regulator of viral defense system